MIFENEFTSKLQGKDPVQSLTICGNILLNKVNAVKHTTSHHSSAFMTV